MLKGLISCQTYDHDHTTTTSDALTPSPYNWIWGALCDTGIPTKNGFLANAITAFRNVSSGTLNSTQ